jgi:putative ABC transport system permease protein
MWMITLRDLQWRRRRFVIAVFVTAMAFALTLIMSGILGHMRNESVRTVGAYPAASWIVTDGATGPFTTSQFLPTSALDDLRSTGGVDGASPLLVVRSTNDKLDVNVVGYEVGGLTEPSKLASGESATGSGQVIVDDSLHRHVGDTLTFAGRSYPVVGTTKNTTFYFSAPTVFLPIEDVQEQFLGGQQLASTIVVTGDQPVTAPDGLDVLTSAQVKADLDRPLATTSQTLSIIDGLLWIMAAGTIGSIVYMTALERTRDFAVFKATGSSGWSMALGLCAEAVILALAAAVVAMILARLIAPTFPFPVEIPTDAYVQLLATAAVAGIVASLVGVRRVVKVDPALAFGGV